MNGFRRRAAGAVAGSLLLVGCAVNQNIDPWVGAGVDHPRISVDGTTVTVHAETTLPLEDESNRDGFALRAAKIAWRTHLGQLDTLRITTLQRDHPDSRRERTWRRAELALLFGDRLTGLDAGDEAAVRPRLPAGPGPYRGATADRLPQAVALFQRIAREPAVGLEPAPGEPRIEECFGGLAGTERTGEYRAYATVDLPVPRDTQPSQLLVATAAAWAELGLEVNRSGMFTGDEDRVRGELPDVGNLTLAERSIGIPLLTFSYSTECRPT